jgi:hypothetical protein
VRRYAAKAAGRACGLRRCPAVAPGAPAGASRNPSLFPSPVVAESLLDRLISTSHQVLMTGPGYRPRKRPGRIPLATKNDTG